MLAIITIFFHWVVRIIYSLLSDVNQKKTKKQNHSGSVQGPPLLRTLVPSTSSSTFKSD